MRWEQPIQFASISDIGFRRRNNQDSFVVQVCSEKEIWQQHGHLFIVADGMGGHAVGELASKIAVDTIPLTFFKSKEDVDSAIREAVENANNVIHERGTQNREFARMGTTCVALVLGPSGAVTAHVGDSRIYRIRKGRLDQLTFDHSLQWEMLRQGRLKPEEIYLHESRHVITRSLGPEKETKVDTEGPYAILPNDKYLLCSDGLTGHVADDEIAMIVHELPVGDACRLLVHLANLRGGSDNITVVIAHAGEIPDGVTDEPIPETVSEPPSELGWEWLVGFWTVAALLLVGICLFLFGKFEVGAVMSGVSVIAGYLIFARWSAKRAAMALTSGDNKTVKWNSYASASCKLTPKFLNDIAALESALQRTAVEEGWTIEWSKHEKFLSQAREALDATKFARALRAYAKALDVLMAGVQIHRKQLDQQSKWGKGKDGNSKRDDNSQTK